MPTRKKGFSLLEMLVVVLMLGILVSIALPNYRKAVERTRVGEALTLLHAIYDSCERYAWERVEFDSCGAAIQFAKANPNYNKAIKFSKLAVLAKGTFAGGGLTLKTANFDYTLDYVNSNSTPVAVLSATATRGAYTGASVLYNGQEFTCVAGETSEAAEACARWGSSTWNQ